MAVIEGNVEMRNLAAEVERWRQAVSTGNMDMFGAMYATDAVLFVPLSPDPVRGRQAIRDYEANLRVAFPDAKLQLHHPLVKDETVAVEWEYSGKNSGPILTPFREFPPTNRNMHIHGASFLHFHNGVITQERRYYDARTLYQQLGMQ